MGPEDKDQTIIHEISLGIEEVENPDHCLCLDCHVNKNGLSY